MKSKLKIITDKTIIKLLKDEIVLPSTYFETFKENSYELKVDINDDSFESEIDKILSDESSKITKLIDTTISKIDDFSKETTNAKNAIDNNDKNELSKINATISNLKKDLDGLKEELYTDELCKAKNRKWLFSKYLTNHERFESSGISTLLKINDFNHLSKEYGELVANNIVKYLYSSITESLEQEKIEFEIVRFTNNQFILFIKEKNVSQVNFTFKNIRKNIMSKTLKTNSGLILKINFDFKSIFFTKNDSFINIIEELSLQ